MRKLLVILFCLLILVGCNKGVEVEPVVEEVGTYVDSERELDEKLLAIFNEATVSLGVVYTPIKLLQTQVVAGTNYRFLAMCGEDYKVLTVYEDLEGKVSLSNIEDYVEVKVGGWTDRDQELDDKLLEIFNEAVEGLDGVSYRPIKLLASQVVAGMNYKFLVEDSEGALKVLTVYQDLEGKVSVSEIIDYQE